MRRVVVTGTSAITSAGVGVDRFESALRRGEPLARPRKVPLPRGRSRSILHAPLEGFDPSDLIRPGLLRRMSPEAQVVTSAFLLAWQDAGAGERSLAPERTGTFLGTGFGCMFSTAEYLRGILSGDLGAASPFLFSESLASSPLGHAAIALDARGPSMAFTCGDASMVVALGECWRAIRRGRIDVAVCAGFAQMSQELLELLTRLAARTGKVPVVGDGAVALVLEELERARGSGARILAEVLAFGEAGDPGACPTDWSHDEAIWAAAHGRALERAGARHALVPGVVFRHAPPSPGPLAAESRALDRLRVNERIPDVRQVHHVFGSHAAAGGLSALAGALACGGSSETVLISAGSWGGAVTAAVMGAPGV